MIEDILIPLDGSEHSKAALEFACQIADKKNVTLHLLHIAQPPAGERVMVLGAAAVRIDTSPEELEAAGKKVLNSAEDLVRGKGFEKVATRVTGGDPTQRILEYAKEKDVDMIVMGSRGLSDLTGLVLGSVSHKVNHLAPCTCVTVR